MSRFAQVTRNMFALAMPLAVATCTDGTGPGAVGPPGITILAGASVTDTVDTRPSQALMVEVREAGGMVATGAVVRFRSLRISNPVANVYVGRLDGASFATLAVDSADDRGRAGVLIAFGYLAGDGGVEITVPELGYADTAEYRVLAGAAVRVVGAPEDTVVYVGVGYALRGTTRDRYGNHRSDPVSFAADSAHASVSPTGTVTGETIGRARFRLTAAGGLADTVWASVAPRGVVAAVYGQLLVTIELDGSNFDTLAAPPGPAASWVDWNARGDTVVFGSSDYDSWLYVTGVNGPVRRLITTTTGLLSEYRPQFSADGQWIHFGGRDDWQNQAIWRVRPDGSSPERIGPASGYYDSDGQPSPSSDGLRSAFLTNRCCYPNLGLRVLHVGSGAVDSLAPSALSPRWSPGDSLIGFVTNGIWAIRPDGTGLRLLSQPGRLYDQGFDWSPTGEWIVAVGASGYLELIRTSDALTLTLRHLHGLLRPSWRP